MRNYLKISMEISATPSQDLGSLNVFQQMLPLLTRMCLYTRVWVRDSDLKYTQGEFNIHSLHALEEQGEKHSILFRFCCAFLDTLSGHSPPKLSFAVLGSLFCVFCNTAHTQIACGFMLCFPFKTNT